MPASSKTKSRSNTLQAGAQITENRRARRDYEISDTFEAGIELRGTEVKSLRAGRANIAHAFANIKDGEAFLMNADIPEYEAGNQFNHNATRTRKLLMHRREINRLQAGVQREGMTLIPLKLYFNKRGMVKLLLALARGRQKADKRQVEKKRDWQREQSRLLRNK
ncbi:MAG: SsrA-binding protein SmpB [Alphaproteobacteria bacterium]|nr:SsrA-binding protein SmpB [Alphaproteobacteria bacterium]